VLSAAQIRELMGAVPNAVFERLLEAVAAGQSAELMEQLNLLVNAGHSPSSLARQMVRYLRNTLMAKLGGEQTELLQISGDERARAVRTALLFTEEDLTRNLQIVLRTFDDLNYRQEQRFHLELGLLKLIHAQRLLPIEELLSGVSGSSAGRGAAASSAPRSASSPSPAPPRPVPTPSPAPSISPFGSAGESWSASPSNSAAKPDPGLKMESAAGPVATMERPASVPLAAVAIATEAATPSLGAPSMEALRHAIGAALVNAEHSSAAQLLGSGAWTLDGASLRIEVPCVGKKMLALTVNAVAEKIIRQELQRLGAPTRFLVVPGEGSVGTAQAQAPMAAPLAGSIQEAALGNPLVQRAQEIFKAEVRSVVDLRQK
jgi:DNA polymerase-3 subunit gamma/tau